jgi:porphyrinogen peroxidase
LAPVSLVEPGGASSDAGHAKLLVEYICVIEPKKLVRASTPTLSEQLMTLTPIPQPVNVPLTRAALFLVATINPGDDPRTKVRSLCGDLSSLVRAVGFRSADAGLSCVMGIGSGAWDRLFGQPRPAQLHPFREILASGRHAVATPGDLLFHIRARHFDFCFELGTQITARLGDAVSVVDEVHGFRYFDARDLLGFVDGTENPAGQAAIDATLIGPENAAFSAGSYVITQKYLHDLATWNALPTEQQERIIGRSKLSDIEIDDAKKAPYAHNALTKIEKARLKQWPHKSLGDKMLYKVVCCRRSIAIRFMGNREQLS